MANYKVVAYVDGRRTETIIRAYTMNDAEKLFRAQYSNSKVTNLYITRI